MTKALSLTPENLPPLQAVTNLPRQVGALCWRKHRGEVQVLLVTSRETGRWVVPKGWLIPGLTDGETAAREAFEEAGVMAKPDHQKVGVFFYSKIMARDLPQQSSMTCQVDLFAMRVLQLRGKFPEAGQRRRKWFDRKSAATQVEEPALQALIAAFDPLSKGKAVPEPKPEA